MTNNQGFEITVSNICNLNCKHCGMSNIINQDNKIINYDLLLKTLKIENNKIPISEIYLWGGEPLLGDLDKIIELIDTFPNTKFKITTNLCIPLNDKRIEILKKCYLVSTSFDPKIRFDNIKNLNLWYHNCKKLKKIIKNFMCVSTITSHIVHIKLNKLIKLFDDIGFDYFMFSPLVVSGSLIDNKYLLPSPQDYIRFINEIIKIKSRKNSTILKYINNESLKCFNSPNSVINNNGKFITCTNNSKCELIDQNCYICDNFKICGGKSPCIEKCLFSKEVYEEAIRSYNYVYKETTK